jgi:hypothetical protein
MRYLLNIINLVAYELGRYEASRTAANISFVGTRSCD